MSHHTAVSHKPQLPTYPTISLQISTFVFNHFHDALPATPFISNFCIVARGWYGSACPFTPFTCVHPYNPRNPRLRSSPLFSYSSALFCATGASQPLSYQSFAHSFPCNGGGYMSQNGARPLRNRNIGLPGYKNQLRALSPNGPGKPFIINTLRENSTSGNFMEQTPRTPRTRANNVQHFLSV